MPASTTASAGFTSGAATSLTISHASDTNPLYVLLSWFVSGGAIDSTDVVTGITYNGVALTRGGRAPVAGNTMEWWRLSAPSSGTHDLVITLSSARRISAGVVNLTGWPSELAAHNFVASGHSGTPPSVTVASIVGGEVISWIGFNDPNQNVTAPSGATELWNQELTGGGVGAGGDQVSAASIQDGDAVSVTLAWAGSVGAEYFGVAAISTTETSKNNLLTGENHTVQGSDNVVAGSGGTVTGNRNVLFALCNDSPSPSIAGDDTFKVCAAEIDLTADEIDLTASVITVNGETLVTSPRKHHVGITVDGGTDDLTTGIKGFCPPLSYAGTIIGWELQSTDPSVLAGSIVMDVWKDVKANYPPTVADTITASAKPSLSSATHNDSTTLTGWTTSVAVGDVIGFNIDSVSGLKRITFVLVIQES